MNTITNLLFSSFLILPFFAAAQIKFSETAKPIVKEKVFHYDSTKNFVGKNVGELKGQELYVVPQKEHRQKYGYSNFYDTYVNTRDFSFENITYELYAGHTFVVEEVLPKHPESRSKNPETSILKLRDKESGRECYYAYDAAFLHSYPFITMGFYEKEKRKCIGKQIVIKPEKNWRKSVMNEKDPVYDFKTGLEVKIDPNEPWTIQDLTVEDLYYTLSYIITNAKGETLSIDIVSVDDFHTKYSPYALSLNDTLKQIKNKQPEFYQDIMKSNFRVGMTMTMVRYAFGKPESVYSSSMGTTWGFRGGIYLYFKNGILTSYR